MAQAVPPVILEGLVVTEWMCPDAKSETWELVAALDAAGRTLTAALREHEGRYVRVTIERLF